MEFEINGIKIKFDIAPFMEDRDINANENEAAVFAFIKSLCPAVELVRRSEAYLTAAVGINDVVRFKCTDRAKWINVCYVDLGKVKRRFEKIDDLAAFKDDIIKSYDYAIKNA